MVNPLRRLDRLQQRWRALAFPFAVVRKFGDDQAGSLAALVAYWGFFSLFPLLLVLVTMLGIVLRGHSALQRSILSSALTDFPVIGADLQRGTHALSGHASLSLVIGIGLALWAALGVLRAMALNFGLFMLAFRILTTADVSWSDVRVGAAVGAVAWTALQALGGYLVGHLSLIHISE